MTKREFLDRLERCLASLDAGERAAMVDFYSEQIEDRIDDGMTETQAVASLESPEDIAANILAQRADTPDPAAQDGGAPQKPAKPGQAQDQRKGFGHAAGKVLLWICAAIGILILFALLIIRGYWIAMHARDRFSMLLAAGLTTLLALQVFLNVAVVTNLLPSTGISLPFFSYGGTALIMQLAENGIVLNVSRSITQSPR